MIKLLKRLDKKEKLFVLISIVFIVCQVWLDLRLPDYMSEITKLLQTSGTTVKQILSPGIKMIVCALGSLTSAIICGYFTAYVASSFGKKIRREVFTKVESFSMQEIKDFSTASLITRTTNDVSHVQHFIAMGMQLMIKAPILAIWAVTKIAGKNLTWSMVTGCGVLFLLVMVSIIIIFAVPKFKIIQNLTDNLNRITRENLTGIRVIRAFNAEKYQENKFNYANSKLTDTNLFTNKVMMIISPGMHFIMQMLTLAIYFFGASMINNASLLDKIDLFSNMVVFSSYSMQVIMAFMMLSMLFVIYPRASVSAKRILEVLNTKNKIIDGSVNKNMTNEIGTIEFKNVSFKYPDAEEYMLENINFSVKRGETVAFIGSTGSGKSTLINLIPRFYDATDGEIFIDGVNVKEYNLEFLYTKFGYIPQKSVMFSGTVKSNINFGNNGKTNLNKIKEAVRVAQAEDFVLKMQDTYDAHIAQGGTNISGGQKQRLAIARAIARDPEIYIFDDSFSALDYKTDYNLRKDLKKYTKDATVLIVAQRIGTIRNADQIIVLDNGKMVGHGTHRELMDNCPVYKEIALSQLTEEELYNE